MRNVCARVTARRSDLVDRGLYFGDTVDVRFARLLALVFDTESRPASHCVVVEAAEMGVCSSMPALLMAACYPLTTRRTYN